MMRILQRVSLHAFVLLYVMLAYSQHTSQSPIARQLAPGTTASLPLFFEVNRGQTDSRVRFLSRSSGFTLFLTPSEIALVQGRTWVGGQQKVSATAESSKVWPAVVRMTLVGANVSSELTGVDELPGKVNYLIGQDPHAWHTGVPLYSQVRAQQVYPGVDLIFHGDNRQLEYDFVVAAGADPNCIAFHITGAKRMELDAYGDLVLHTDGGQIRMHKPVIYQPAGAGHSSVAGNFALGTNGDVSFRVGQYDPHRTLVIDPSITYASFLGGAGGDNGGGMSLDTTTNANAPKMYVPGITTDITTFPEPHTLIGVSPGGTYYAFLAKIDPSLTGAASLDYLTFIGGSVTFAGAPGCWTGPTGLGLDTSLGPSSVQPVIVGFTNCKDYPVTTTTPTSGPDDLFVTRLMPGGANLDLSIFFGGNGEEPIGSGLGTVDSSGNVILASYTTSTDLPATATAYATSLNNGAAGFEDCFVAKLSRSFVVQYLTYLNVGAGTVSADANSLACVAGADASGQILAGGVTIDSTAFVAAGGANGFQTTFKGVADTFLMKLDPTKSGTKQLTYASYFGGGGITAFGGAAALGTGVVAFAGNTTSGTTVNPQDIPLKNAYLKTNLASSSSDKGIGFFAVVDTTKTGASSLICSSYFGGSGGDDKVQAMAYDPVPGSNTYQLVMGGQTTSTNFPLMNPLQSKLTGVQNGWVSIVKAPTRNTGPAATLAFSTYIGGSLAKFGPQGTNEAIQGVAVDGAHTIYAHGRTLSDDFFAHTSSATVVNGFQPKCSSCSPTHATPADDAVVFVLPNPTAVATTTTLTSSLNPSTYGQAVTLTATVKSTTTSTPTGTVTFMDGATALGTETLAAGVTKFTSNSLSVRVHSITAVYGGSISFFGSKSAVLKQTVNKAATSTSLTSTPNPSKVGQAVKFMATVKAATSGTPIGTVTFKDGTTTLGSSTLAGGKATFTTSKLVKGSHSITCVYGGSGNYIGSTSTVLTQIVD
jgi:hypothetical protein